MATNYSPKIVTDGLVLCLDAANQKSYPGSGTTWSDLSNENVNGTLRNSPTFSQLDGGYFVLGGNQDMVTNQTPVTLQGNPNLTVSGWFKRLVNHGTNRGIWGIGGNATSQGLNSFWLSNANQIAFDIWSGARYGTGTEYPLNQWVFVTWQKIAGPMINTNIVLWQNTTKYTGSQLITLTSGSQTPNINNVGVTLARISPTHTQTSASGFQFSKFIVYDRVLTEQEVIQNFQATRGRYGI
jgi:hypothetical protein